MILMSVRPVLSAIYLSVSAGITMPPGADVEMTPTDARMIGEICVGNKNTLDNQIAFARETLQAVGQGTPELDKLASAYKAENKSHAEKLAQNGYSPAPCLNL
ncbi:MAG: hypothetical protein DI626_01910 [Micavibrio aeruginosavorus]|uniref:Uncharacterized protein n=1 Tax=Micavibrio aeruginosavorus TaxID=349221 RepID=A0A2W5A4A5_9BACT|nr:MAG: hypothetical protein DI626_01910 [Micavibrio aeruginosavorus]